MPFERQCAFARSVGYDGIEIAPFTLTDDPTRLPAAQAAAMAPRRDRCRDRHHQPALSAARTAPGCRSPRPMQASATARSTSCARCAGWPPISAPASWCMARPINARSSPGEEDEGRKRGVDCFAAVAEAAAQARVVYCIEPLSRHETQFVNTVEEAAAIVRAIGSPAVRTMIDCSAAGQAEASPGRRPGAPLGAHRPHRPHPFQRPEPARSGRRNDGIRTHSRGARRHQISLATPPSSRSFTSPTAPHAPRARSAICAA